MEPKTPAGSPEQMPSPVEYTPSLPGFEVSPEQTQERVGERAPEFQGEQHRATTAVSSPALPVPVGAPTTNDNTTLDAAVPDVAADEDLIEKEWVDKAKKILAETKDDPYRREQAINKLQIEYVRKRYGRIIGDSGD